MSVRSNGIGLVLHVVEREGLTGIIPYIVRWVRRRLPGRNLRRMRAGKEFDRKFGLSTAGEIHLPCVHDGEALWYQATAPDIFSAMISSLPREAIAHYSFVDIGCGKGRVLILAAEHGFQEIVGLEVSRELYLDARKNLELFQSSRRKGCAIRIDNVDACDYRIPASPCVLFLYNTLGPRAMRRFVAMVEESLAENPRDLFILYYNPEWRGLWEQSGAFAKLAGNLWSPDSYVIYRAVCQQSHERGGAPGH